MHSIIITIIPMMLYDHTPQDDHASKMRKLVESHTSEIAALREEFRKEMERKLVEEKKDMKVNNSITTLHTCEF